MPEQTRRRILTIAVASLVSIGTLVTFAMVGPSGFFIDEYDAIRGAQVMAEGGILHADYFTHHMPLMYFLLTPLLWLIGSDLVLLRVAFGIVLGLWLLTMSRHLWRAWGLWVAVGFVAVVVGAFLLGFYNQMMAETVIAWATAHAVILFITRRSSSAAPTLRLAAMVVLATLPTLLALAYLPVSAVLGALAVTFAAERRRDLAVRGWVVAGLALIGPTALLALYFVVNGAVGDVLFQAFTFNTKYYSQINPAAPSGPLEAAVTVIRVFATGLWQSFTLWDIGSQPSVAIITAATLGSLAWFTARRRWRTIGWAVLLLVASGSRGLGEGAPQGFAAVLGHNQWARHGETVLLVELLLVLFAVVDAVSVLRARASTPTDSPRRLMAGAIAMTVAGAAFAGAVLVPGVPAVLTAAREVRNGIYTIAAYDTTPAVIINLVNDDTDTYWAAPAEWDQEVHITSRIASRYPFYMDQVGICAECRDELVRDLLTEQPRVIYFRPVTIYGRAVVPSLRAEIEDAYFEVDDDRLAGFLFLEADRDIVIERLAAAGYSVN